MVEGLRGHSKLKEGSWRSVFELEDLRVAPRLMFLLDTPNQRHRDKNPPRKFSTMVKRMVVELS